MKASIDSIETFGLVDGPGIRFVIFFNGCKLRCKYCHNPEMWTKKEENTSVDEIFEKIKRSKPYFNQTGGVTFSGGEPLLHGNFIIELTKRLKKEGIHTAIDTAGVGIGNYKKILENIDLVILDIKHVENDNYLNITGQNMQEVEYFIKEVNNQNKPVWIRQVVIPDITDTEDYIEKLINYLKRINNIEKVEFLPFHRLGREKYVKLNIDYPYEDKNDMDKEKCNKLYELFISKYKKRK